MTTQPVPLRHPSHGVSESAPGATDVIVRTHPADHRHPVLHVDLPAVAANTRALRARTTASLMAVVKADGFGLGASAVARAALGAGATSLGVTTVDEALALRAEGVPAPVLAWLTTPDADWTAAVTAGVDLAIPSVEHLDGLAAAVRRTGGAHGAARIHLHADTGMARDGAAPDTWLRLCASARAAERAGLVRVVGLMGHLACAEDGPDTGGRQAFDRFAAVALGVGLRPTLRHLGATAAALDDPASHHDLLRVGAGLYGIDPTGRHPGVLRTPVTLTAPVTTVRDVEAGTFVGYGHTHCTTRATRLATLPVGYADGIPRVPTGTASVSLHGRRCAVVGRVSMDQVVVDAGDLPVATGDLAVVLGPGDRGEPTPAEWARWSGTIPHEVLTGLGPRIHRVLRPVHPSTTGTTPPPTHPSTTHERNPR